jgi:hypothetical protein
MPRPRLRLGTLALLIVIFALTMAVVAQWRREQALRVEMTRMRAELSWMRAELDMTQMYVERTRAIGDPTAWAYPEYQHGETLRGMFRYQPVETGRDMFRGRGTKWTQRTGIGRP